MNNSGEISLAETFYYKMVTSQAHKKVSHHLVTLLGYGKNDTSVILLGCQIYLNIKFTKVILASSPPELTNIEPLPLFLEIFL